LIPFKAGFSTLSSQSIIKLWEKILTIFCVINFSYLGQVTGFNEGNHFYHLSLLVSFSKDILRANQDLLWQHPPNKVLNFSVILYNVIYKCRKFIFRHPTNVSFFVYNFHQALLETTYKPSAKIFLYHVLFCLIILLKSYSFPRSFISCFYVWLLTNPYFGIRTYIVWSNIVQVN
jgi:hypothetical protein